MKQLTRLDPIDARVRTTCENISLHELRLKQTQEIVDDLLALFFKGTIKGRDIIGESLQSLGYRQIK